MGYVEIAKDYIQKIIEYFMSLKDKIDGVLDYVKDIIEHVVEMISDAKQSIIGIAA
ncbi:hypothetical protein [Flavobacterium kingsejongi]|nr:hypothetical protein [Flavobacterium kingsejongi]